LTSDKLLRVTGDTLTLSGTGPFTLGAGLNLSGGTLTGASAVTVSAGSVVWTGGTLSGTGQLTAGGGLQISGTGNKFLTGRTLVNAGLAAWSGGNLLVGGGGSVSNQGTFEIQADVSFANQFGGAALAFTNTGTLRKSGGTGTSAFGYATL